MSTENLITQALEACHVEGVSMSELGSIEAKLTTLLYQARRIRNAASMLPLLGIETTAERLRCHRSTVYRLAEKHADYVRSQSRTDAA